MSTTKGFRLKENAREFTAGQYTGFGMSFGQKHKDKDKQDVWTNYECAIFTSNQNQIDFYRTAFVAGTVVIVTAANQEMDIQQGNDGRQFRKIKLLKCNVDNVFTAQATPQTTPQGGYQQPAPQQPAPQQPAPQQSYNQQPTQNQNQPRPPQQQAAPQPAYTGFDDFDDDIPFN